LVGKVSYSDSLHSTCPQKLVIHRFCPRPGLNFINVLRTAFTLSDPKSVKDTYDLTVFFTLSGSTSVKAAHKTLVKLTPGPIFSYSFIIQFCSPAASDKRHFMEGCVPHYVDILGRCFEFL